MHRLRRHRTRTYWSVLLFLISLFSCSSNPPIHGHSAADADILAVEHVVSGFPPLSGVPSDAELDQAAKAVNDEVNSGKIAAKDFRRSAGDTQLIDADIAAGTTAWVTITPHKGSNKGSGSESKPVPNGKLLAVIESDRDVPRLGLKTGLNYWVAGVIADVPVWAIMVHRSVPAGRAQAVMMNRTPHVDGKEPHDGPVARWSSLRTRGPSWLYSEEAWATCDPDGCCCTGSRSCGF